MVKERESVSHILESLFNKMRNWLTAWKDTHPLPHTSKKPLPLSKYQFVHILKLVLLVAVIYLTTNLQIRKLVCILAWLNR